MRRSANVAFLANMDGALPNPMFVNANPCGDLLETAVFIKDPVSIVLLLVELARKVPTHAIANQVCYSLKNSKALTQPQFNEVLKSLMQQQRPRRQKRHLKNKHLRNAGYFRVCNYCYLLAFYVVAKTRYKWTGRSAVGVNITNKRFVCQGWIQDFEKGGDSFVATIRGR